MKRPASARKAVAATGTEKAVRLLLVATTAATFFGAIGATILAFELSGDPSTPEFRATDALNHCLFQPAYLTSAQQCPLPAGQDRIARRMLATALGSRYRYG
jgi:hypothetical protein